MEWESKNFGAVSKHTLPKKENSVFYDKQWDQIWVSKYSPPPNLPCAGVHKTVSGKQLWACSQQNALEPLLSVSCASHLFAQRDPHAAEDFANGFEEGVAESVNADGVDSADTLDLDQVALHTGNHNPYMNEGQDGEVYTPDEGQGDADQSGEDAVTPVFGDCERGKAGLPYTIKAVGAVRFCNDILKINLYNIIVQVLAVPVNQIDFFSVNIKGILLFHTVVIHDFILWFVDIPLLSNEWWIQKSLWFFVLATTSHASLT